MKRIERCRNDQCYIYFSHETNHVVIWLRLPWSKSSRGAWTLRFSVLWQPVYIFIYISTKTDRLHQYFSRSRPNAPIIYRLTVHLHACMCQHPSPVSFLTAILEVTSNHSSQTRYLYLLPIHVPIWQPQSNLVYENPMKLAATFIIQRRTALLFESVL